MFNEEIEEMDFAGQVMDSKGQRVGTPGEWLDDPKFKATEGDFLKPKLGNGLDRAKPKH